jgi:ABC-type antimicrobial peptide transport system permease subunit
VKVNLISEGVQQAIARERLLGRVTALLAAMAGLLAAIGLYGVLAYAVAQRTREIGVRIALGAPPLAIVRWVTSQMFALVLLGLVLGLAGGAALARLVRGHLFGVTPLDIVSNLAAAAGLLALGALAVALPARAATRVEPATALHSD